MLNFVDNYFEFGFCKNHLPQVSRVYFEAISVGVHYALIENENLIATKPSIEKWRNSNEFKTILSGKYHTHTPKRLKDRIEYVTKKLLAND